MPDIKKVIENPDTPSPQRADRELDLQNWSQEQAQQTATDLGIDLTDAHWDVIVFLQSYYLEAGPPKNGREIGDVLETRFASQGGRRYLRKLFPEGPVRQGMQIAGLPVPPHTEDEGFGTSR